MPDLLISSETLNAAIDHAREELGSLSMQILNDVYAKLGVLSRDLIRESENAVRRVIDDTLEQLQGLSLTVPGITISIPAIPIRLVKRSI